MPKLLIFDDMEIIPDKKAFVELANARMPFGKHKGKYLSDIPTAYLSWFRTKGFPDGKLGLQMASVLEMKINGLTQVLRELRYKEEEE